MTTFIIFGMLIGISVCNATIMYAREGEMMLLEFVYPCNSTRITLQYGNRAPCYSSAEPKHMSMPPNQRLAFENDSQVCSVQWTIDPVLRDDAGTYILTAYKNGIMLPDYPRIGLRVEYPPGRATCQLSDYHHDAEWLSLRCTAPRGTLPGHILCYQNGLRLPTYTHLQQTDRTITQTILARSANMNVFCCSTLLQESKDKCECKDFGWDPSNKTTLTEISPCPIPATVQTSEPMSSVSPTQDIQIDYFTMPTKIPDISKCQCNTDHVTLRNSISTVISLAITLIIIIIIHIMLSARHILKTGKIEKRLENFGDFNKTDTLQRLRTLLVESE
ncbi:uncharacterized protein LOC121422037 [Lytechinus variegatus]|uniref:uncharacterized protein LOC121422037 n=1 Tax=Lytechinus variegatus TaxID=7654 RepID=UPI001BB12260|nr:uncharacterized protein LOC121422037 [Lytechinus variegatus]